MKRRHKTALGITLGIGIVAIISLYFATGAISSESRGSYRYLTTDPEVIPIKQTPHQGPVILAAYREGHKDGVELPGIRRGGKGPELLYFPIFPEVVPQPRVEDPQTVQLVPEPGVLSLVILGILSLLGLRKGA